MTRPGPTSPRPGTDRARLHERSEALARAITGDARLSPEEARATLEARARALAAPLDAPAEGEALELVVFRIAEERYAVEARFLIEATRSFHVAVIPGAEPPLLGITAWRGGLLTLFDIRRILGLAAASAGDASRMLVLGEGQPAFGILVDAVEGLAEVQVSEIRPLPGKVHDGGGFLRGTTSEAVLVLSELDLIRAHT